MLVFEDVDRREERERERVRGLKTDLDGEADWVRRGGEVGGDWMSLRTTMRER